MIAATAHPATATIFALSSAPGRAAVAVIRVSGALASDVVVAMTGKSIAHREAAPRVIRHPSNRQILDYAVVLFFAGPRSETGEDIAEFQLHGSRAVVVAVLDALGTINGCRLALPGEFARRAFDNGKIDLTTAEGIADLIDAETEHQRTQALVQASGALNRLYSGWRADLIRAQGLVEAAIDFADEGDVSDGAFEQALVIAIELEGHVRAHLALANRGEILRNGYRVVLTGPPNAGKSTLLNTLARREAAIVSEEPGTTRDVIEVRLDLGGLAVIVSDTAGIREAQGAIEREGIRRTVDQAARADLVLWLTEAGGEMPPPPPQIGGDGVEVVHVATKIDLIQADGQGCDRVKIASQTGCGLGELTDLIVARARARIGTEPAVAPTQARHRTHLEATLMHLTTFRESPKDEVELRAEDLRQAANELGRLTGRIDPEDVLAEIFGRFCIGK